MPLERRKRQPTPPATILTKSHSLSAITSAKRAKKKPCYSFLNMNTTNLKTLANQELHNHTKRLVAKERELTTEVLHTLAEVERRKLFAELGFSSLFSYCTQALGYSEASAQRRITAMRLIKQIPDIEPKIAQGTLNLSTVSKAQSFFKQEAKSSNPLNTEQKLEVLTKLEGMSSRKCDQELAARSSNPEALKKPDRIAPVSQTSSEIRFVASEELTQAMEQIRGLLAHKNPNMSLGELFLEMARVSLEQLTKEKTKALKNTEKNTEQNTSEKPRDTSDDTVAPAQHTTAPAKTPPLPTSEVKSNSRSRHIPRAVQRAVYARDGMQCSYVDPVTGRRCDSRFALELDHIRPFALGGAATADNFLVRCKNHNQLHSIQSFGLEKALNYSKQTKQPT